MTPTLDETHDPQLTSWVATAQAPGTDFPIQNLPFGVFRHPDRDERARVGVAIGDQIFDVAAARHAELLGGAVAPAAEACDAPALNGLMALGRTHWSGLRHAVSRLLRTGSPMRDDLLVPMTRAEMLVPARVGDYSDFYASVHHATNVGSMFRPDNPLLPNYKHVPIGYHGRASSIVATGTPVRRPAGQLKDAQADAPEFGPSRLLDYEMEVGCFVGRGNALGTPIPLAEIDEHIFGLCLVNDWSARDIQSWEYQPLGPFLAKNFATTVSPWVVTLEALAPFRTAAYRRPAGDPTPLPYLDGAGNRDCGGFDITLEVSIRSRRMRDAGEAPARLSRSTFSDMYWTLGQMLTHHASNGCNLRPGDLIASGTVSGAGRDERGCMLELTWRGAEPITLPDGDTRKFLQDGDEIIMRGSCERAGAVRIGFGECRGEVLPAG
ncbi:MAG: fumarylacetoacetase [Gemmatimonadota bacterium]